MKKLFLFLLILFSCCARFDAQTHRLPAPQSPVAPVEPILIRPFTNDARCRQWVDSVLNKMSLKERIGQLFIYTIAPQQDKANRDLLRQGSGRLQSGWSALFRWFNGKSGGTDQ